MATTTYRFSNQGSAWAVQVYRDGVEVDAASAEGSGALGVLGRWLTERYPECTPAPPVDVPDILVERDRLRQAVGGMLSLLESLERNGNALDRDGQRNAIKQLRVAIGGGQN